MMVVEVGVIGSTLMERNTVRNQYLKRKDVSILMKTTVINLRLKRQCLWACMYWQHLLTTQVV